MRHEWDCEIDALEESSVREMADLLSAGQSEVLERRGLLLRITAQEADAAIGSYRGRLTSLPAYGFDFADVAQSGPSGDEFILDLPLWTPTGRSDVVVSFMIRRNGTKPPVAVWDVGMP